jgi:hypothetical protein
MRSKVRIRLMIFLIFLFCFSYGVSLAQDPGDADTVKLANISGEIADMVSMPVFLYNDEELVSVIIPLLLDGYSGWLSFDSVSYVGSRLDDPTVLDERQVYVLGTDTFTVDSLFLSFSVSSGENLPAGTGKLCGLWFTLHFGGEVLVDSFPDSPQGGLLLTDTNKGSFTPQFSSGLIDVSCDYLMGDVGQGDGYVNVADIITLQKLYFYDAPGLLYDRWGAGDLNCDRRLDMRDLIYLWDVIFDVVEPCTCGTINPPFYDDPGLPDTIWVESETLIVGISSPICIGVINDEPVNGMALALEWDGSAVLEWDWETYPIFTDRIDDIPWIYADLDHSDGVNPDTFLLYGFMTSDTIPLSPGRDAVCCPSFIPQSAGTATFRLVSWVNAGQSMLVTEDHAAALPAFYGGNITVLPYLPGDPNHDGIVDIADVVYLINYLFVDGPDPLESGDVTCNGTVDIADVIYLINYLFIGGPPPCSPPTGILLNYYGCKEFQKGTAIDSIPPDQDCIEYQYDGSSVLLLKHINAGFNCCPDEILAEITIESNVITIDENESLEISGGCYCLCLFDVDYEITNLPPGVYTIKINGLYLEEGDEPLEFTIDLASSPSGIFCVHRDHYPWGIW